jgi:acyl carrier protein
MERTGMTRDEVENRVHEVLALVLKLPNVPAQPLRREDVPTWDSLSHIEIIYAVEEGLGVTFSEHEMAGLDGSTAIVDAVERLRAA